MQTIQSLLLFFCVGLGCFAQAQDYQIDQFQLDRFGGLIKLGWQSQKGNVYSLESSTNLMEWSEVKRSPLSLMRFTGAVGARTEIEFGLPPTSANYYRVRKLPVIDVGTLGNELGQGATVKDVNNGGRVVGYFESKPIPDICGGDEYFQTPTGFTWIPGGELVTFGLGSTAIAVNEQHMVVGRTYDCAVGNYRFFSWTPDGGMVDRGVGNAVDVNASGHILGYEVDPGVSARAFLWKPGSGKIYLPHLDPVHGSTIPTRLNDAGHVVGDSLIDKSYYRAFYWTESGGVVDIADAQSNALDVNNSGQVIGLRTIQDGTSRGYLWSPTGGMITYPAEAFPSDINNKGQVVGRFLVDNQSHGFSWTSAAGIVDLGVLAPNQGGWSSSHARRVNENGRILGDSLLPIPGTGGAITQAVFWSPETGMIRLETLSEPSAFAACINDNGIAFGTAGDSVAAHVVMWDTNPSP